MSFLNLQTHDEEDTRIMMIAETDDDYDDMLHIGQENDKHSECMHLEKTNIGGTGVCTQCGMKLDEELMDSDAKYYFKSGNNKNNSRHHKRKNDERSLYEDLSILNIPERVIYIADNYYKRIIQNKIYRSKNRKSIVFACTYYAYIDINEPQPPELLAKLFQINKKRQSRGILTFSKIIRDRKTKHIKPIDLIEKILHDLSLENKPKLFESIKTLYQYLDNKNIFKGSNPYSVASGLVFYYLKDIMTYEINKNYYAKIVNLTNITFETVSNKIKLEVDNEKRFEMIKEYQSSFN